MLCVELEQIEFGKAAAAREHMAHVSDAVGDQLIFHTDDVFEVRHVSKPHIGACWVCLAKAHLESNTCDFGTLRSPSGRCRACIADVVERECLVKPLILPVVSEVERTIGNKGVCLGLEAEVARLCCALVDAGISLVVGVALVVAGV